MPQLTFPWLLSSFQADRTPVCLCVQAQANVVQPDGLTAAVAGHCIPAIQGPLTSCVLSDHGCFTAGSLLVGQEKIMVCWALGISAKL